MLEMIIERSNEFCKLAFAIFRTGKYCHGYSTVCAMHKLTIHAEIYHKIVYYHKSYHRKLLGEWVHSMQIMFGYTVKMSMVADK